MNILLHKAIEENDPSVLKWLLENCEDLVEEINKDAENLTFKAILYKSDTVLEFFVKQGVQLPCTANILKWAQRYGYLTLFVTYMRNEVNSK